MARHLANALLAVFLLWTMMFSPWTAPQISNFRGTMVASSVLLVVIAFWFAHRDGQEHPLIGYIRSLSTRSKLLHTGIGIVSVITLAILCPRALFAAGVGAAAELFWRGYIQPTFALYWEDGLRIGALELSPRVAACVVTTLLYTAIYIPSQNPMLIGTALATGTLWGTLYYFQPKYYPAFILGHALWSVAVFIWLPL